MAREHLAPRISCGHFFCRGFLSRVLTTDKAKEGLRVNKIIICGLFGADVVASNNQKKEEKVTEMTLDINRSMNLPPRTVFFFV